MVRVLDGPLDCLGIVAGARFRSMHIPVDGWVYVLRIKGEDEHLTFVTADSRGLLKIGDCLRAPYNHQFLPSTSHVALKGILTSFSLVMARVCRSEEAGRYSKRRGRKC